MAIEDANREASDKGATEKAPFGHHRSSPVDWQLKIGQWPHQKE